MLSHTFVKIDILAGSQQQVCLSMCDLLVALGTKGLNDECAYIRMIMLTNSFNQ